jgi:hypothetical protein
MHWPALPPVKQHLVPVVQAAFEQIVALWPLHTNTPSHPHAVPFVPPVTAPQPPHTFAPGSLQVTALVPLQTYIPHDPHAPPNVPPVMAPQPPHAFLPGSLHVTAFVPLQA